MEEENVVKTEEQKNSGMSIAGLVLGIIAVVTFCIWYISIPCAILAIIFSAIGKKKGGKGMSKAGLILGIVSLIVCVVFYVVTVVFIFNASKSMFKEAMKVTTLWEEANDAREKSKAMMKEEEQTIEDINKYFNLY